MIVAYIAGATWVIVDHIEALPGVLAMVFRDAFSGTAATGGFAGAGLAAAIRFGVACGIFSNESGLGTGGIAAAAAQTSNPFRQTLASMTQTCIDTLIVVSFTGLAILVTGAWSTGETGCRQWPGTPVHSWAATESTRSAGALPCLSWPA